MASNQTMNEKPISTTIIILLGGVLLICIGIYTVLRKVGGKVMAIQTHINVTVDFSKWNGNTYDLRIPNHQSIKYLLKNLIDTLKIDNHNGSHFVMKVKNKSIVLTDNDRLIDHQITDGDILQVL